MATTIQPTSGETTKQLINYRVDAGVAVIELSDPPANTYTYEMNRQLDEAILKARMDNDVYVIVLTGAGDKFFSAGANIKMLASVDPTFKYYFCLHANETLLRLEHTPKLVIAALNGHCVGGGLEIAMAADIRIARQDAGKIGIAGSQLGRAAGDGRDTEVVTTGRKEQGHRADGDRKYFFVRRSERDGDHQRYLCAREFHGEHHGICAAVLSAEQSREGRGAHQTCGADRLGDSDGVGAGGRAGKSAAAIPE